MINQQSKGPPKCNGDINIYLTQEYNYNLHCACLKTVLHLKMADGFIERFGVASALLNCDKSSNANRVASAATFGHTELVFVERRR